MTASETLGPASSSPNTSQTSMPTSSMNPVYVVLHKPIYPRNIGMCARAIANMGFQRLILVAPQTKLTDEAKQGAAHAQDILRHATIYPDLAAFYAHEGEGLRIALSGKDARLKKSELIEPVLQSLAANPEHPVQNSSFPVYLYFGAEDDGLSAEEMALCHHVCRIPTYSDVNSLNLSHAVLLVCYLVREALEARCAPTAPASVATSAATSREAIHTPESAPQSGATMVETPLAPAYYPHETVRRWLEALGFDLSSPRINIEKTLQRILLAQTPTADELRLLNSVLQQTVRKLERKS